METSPDHISSPKGRIHAAHLNRTRRGEKTRDPTESNPTARGLRMGSADTRWNKMWSNGKRVPCARNNARLRLECSARLRPRIWFGINLEVDLKAFWMLFSRRLEFRRFTRQVWPEAERKQSLIYILYLRFLNNPTFKVWQLISWGYAWWQAK